MTTVDRRDRILLNPYRDWAKAQRIPIYEGFGLDLLALALETNRWELTGTSGALVQLNGRGDHASVFVIDIPEGGNRAACNTSSEAMLSGGRMTRP